MRRAMKSAEFEMFLATLPFPTPETEFFATLGHHKMFRFPLPDRPVLLEK